MGCGKDEEGFWDGCLRVQWSAVGGEVNADEFSVNFYFPDCLLWTGWRVESDLVVLMRDLFIDLG